MLQWYFLLQKRHRADDEINMREVEVLRNSQWQWIQWRNVAVGDVVKVIDYFHQVH